MAQVMETLSAPFLGVMKFIAIKILSHFRPKNYSLEKK